MPRFAGGVVNVSGGQDGRAAGTTLARCSAWFPGLIPLGRPIEGFEGSASSVRETDPWLAGVAASGGEDSRLGGVLISGRAGGLAVACGPVVLTIGPLGAAASEVTVRTVSSD